MITQKPILFLLVFCWISTICGSTNISEQDVLRVAGKCCNEKKQICCREMITYGAPIGCGYEKDKTNAEILYSCVQNELFKNQNEKKMELDGGMCCQVFSNNQNDPRRRCESTCKKVMNSPSLDAQERLDKIRKCSILSNPLFECFNKCLQLRKDNVIAEIRQFDEYCNSTYLLKDPTAPVNTIAEDGTDKYHRMV